MLLSNFGDKTVRTQSKFCQVVVSRQKMTTDNLVPKDIEERPWVPAYQVSRHNKVARLHEITGCVLVCRYTEGITIVPLSLRAFV